MQPSWTDWTDIILKKVQKLVQALTDMGSPFQKESKDLLTIWRRGSTGVYVSKST